MSPSNSKIFGVGLGRTGTASLAAALEYLGYQTRHFVDYRSLLQDYQADERVFKGETLYALLEHYHAIANGTGLPFRDLDHRYPDSKFILTIKDVEGWLRSKQRYAQLDVRGNVDPETMVAKKFVREQVYGSIEFNEDLWLKAYNRQVNDVTRYFSGRPNDLLVMNISAGQGWETLCPFLGIAQPERPFPHRNSTLEVEEWQANVEEATAEIVQLASDNNLIALIDECNLGIQHVRVRSIPGFEGTYTGTPVDDAAALDTLRRAIADGATHLVIAWPAHWWLDYFSGFSDHLKQRHYRIGSSNLLIVFKIHS